MRTRGTAMDWKAPYGKSRGNRQAVSAPQLPRHLRLHNLRRRSGSSGRMGQNLGFWGWFLWDELDFSLKKIQENWISWDSMGFYGDCPWHFWGHHFVNSFSDRLRHKLPAGSNMIRPNQQKRRTTSAGIEP